MNTKLLKRIIFFSVFTALFMLGVMYGTQYLAKQRALAALPVNTKMGGDFALPSTQGQALQMSSLKGKVVLLNFGFASCPDICPLVLARLGQVLKQLGEDASSVQVVFVSFDPERDTLDILGPYVKHFHPDIIGVTGTSEEIAKVAAQYGVVYMKEDTGSASGYSFAHSDYIYLIDIQGRVRKLYDTRAPIAEMVADARLLAKEDSPF